MIRLRNNLIKVISGAAILFWLISVPVPALASGITEITPGNEQVIYDREAGISQGKTTVNQEETVEEVVTGANEIISEGAADITQSAAVYSDALHGDCPASGTVLLAHIGKCWSCTLFDTIFRSINTLSTAVYNKLAPSCIELLAVFLGIWLIIQIGRYIGSLAEQNPVEFFEGIIAILCKALIAGALLIQPVSRVTDLLISPLIVGATEISIAVTQGFTGTDKIRPNEKQVADLNRDFAIEKQQIEEKYNLKKQALYYQYACQAKCVQRAHSEALFIACNECKANSPQTCADNVYCQNRISKLDRDKENEFKALEQDQSDAIIGLLGAGTLPYHCLLMETEPEANETSALNSQLYNALQCMVGNLHNTTAYGVAMASSILCHAWTAESFGLFPVQFVSLRMLATGVIIWLVCFLLSLLFVFKLIDACFRLGVMLVLLPLLIVAWVFPPTAEFTKKGFQMLIHIMMVFISLAIVLSLALALVEIAFGGNSEVVANGTIVKDAASLKDYFNNNEVYKMANAINFSFFNFIIAMICCVFAIKILSLVDQAATEFSSVFGVGSDIGDRLGMVSARSAALITQASATLSVAGTKHGGGRIANWRASRQMRKSMAAASGGHYQGPGGRSAGGAWTPALAAATDAKTATYAGFDATKFSAIPADIALAKKALNADGSYTRRESLQAKLALRNNDNAKQMYKGGMDGVRSSEQAYTNAKILRNVYGETTVEKMSQGQREALVYKGEAFGITAANKTERVEAMNKMDDNSFNKIKRDVELADKVRQGTATVDEEQKVYGRIANGSEDMKRVLTMSETQFAEYQKSLKDSEAQRASP